MISAPELLITARYIRDRVAGHSDMVSELQSDLRAMYGHFGMPDIGAYSRNAVTIELAKRMSDCFPTGHGSARDLIRHVQEELIFDEVLDGLPIDRCFTIAAHLSDALLQGHHANPTTSAGPARGDWARAIDLACDSVLVHDWTDGASTWKSTFERTYHVAQAAYRLRLHGATLTRDRNTVMLDELSDASIAQLLEDGIRRSGGLTIARRIFSQIAPLYRPEQERYQLVRQVVMLGGAPPAIPFGHLISLAEKHASTRAESPVHPQDWEALCQLATDYAAIIDVQPYTPSFSLQISATSLLRHLQEIAVFDSLFTIQQFRPSDIMDLILGLLDGLDLATRPNGAWSLREALDVIDAILEVSKGKLGPIVMDRRQLSRMLPRLDRVAFTSILDEVLSHRPGSVNLGYLRPVDGQTGITFPRRPLIKHDNRRYFLLDRSLCAPNFLEALFTPLRLWMKDFDTRQVGPAIERFLSDRFRLAGVTPLSGTYAAGSKVLQCDLVIETQKTIFFIEVKKKALTMRARFGSDTSVLLDLAGSMVDALVQSGWHEYHLRRQGHLELKENGSTHSLELGSRQIARIAVSLLDFGGFQDRSFIESFMNGIRPARFETADPAARSRIDGFNRSIEVLNEQIRLIAEIGSESRRPFFDCWFLSVPQLMIVLDGVSNAEEFRNSLWPTRNIQFGSSDFYHDHARIKELMIKPSPIRTA